MLYHLHELQKAASLPVYEWTQVVGTFLHTFAFDDVPTGRYLAAENEMIERATRDFQKPDFGLATFSYTEHGATHQGFIHESIVMTHPFCNLMHFRRTDQNGQLFGQNHPRVLIVAPLSGHYATLLRDTVRTFIPDHEVWITDWKNARDIPLSDGAFSLDDYASLLLIFFNYFKGNVHVVAVCQPVVPVLMAISHLAAAESSDQPLTMTLMGGPIDARVNPGQVNDFAMAHAIDWFQNNIVDTVPCYYPGANRRVCPGFLMLDGFISLNIERHQEASFQLFQHLVKGDMGDAETHRAFYNEYRSVMDVPAEYYIDSIRRVFQDFELPNGHMKFLGQTVRLDCIKKTALLTIEGGHDDISCPGQTLAAHDLCAGLKAHQKQHHFQSDVGHYGIFNGRRFREYIFPKIASFIQQCN